jgi:hypothetical protein
MFHLAAATASRHQADKKRAFESKGACRQDDDFCARSAFEQNREPLRGLEIAFSSSEQPRLAWHGAACL